MQVAQKFFRNVLSRRSGLLKHATVVFATNQLQWLPKVRKGFYARVCVRVCLQALTWLARARSAGRVLHPPLRRVRQAQGGQFA
jgi:hypothetical protein